MGSLGQLLLLLVVFGVGIAVGWVLWGDGAETLARWWRTLSQQVGSRLSGPTAPSAPTATPAEPVTTGHPAGAPVEEPVNGVPQPRLGTTEATAAGLPGESAEDPVTEGPVTQERVPTPLQELADAPSRPEAGSPPDVAEAPAPGPMDDLIADLVAPPESVAAEPAPADPAPALTAVTTVTTLPAPARPVPAKHTQAEPTHAEPTTVSTAPLDAPAETEAAPADTAAPVETEAAPADTAAPVDTAAPADTAVPVETEAAPVDTAVAVDAAIPADTTAPVDAAAPVDTTAPADTTAPVDAGPSTSDDLRRIEGIGPKVAAALTAAGISTYAQLAASPPEELGTTLRKQGMRFTPRLETWIAQAELLAAGDEAGFSALAGELVAGRRARARR